MRDNSNLILVRTETGARIAQRVKHNKVEIFFLELMLSVALLVVGFQGEAHHHLPRTLLLA